MNDQANRRPDESESPELARLKDAAEIWYTKSVVDEDAHAELFEAVMDYAGARRPPREWSNPEEGRWAVMMLAKPSVVVRDEEGITAYSCPDCSKLFSCPRAHWCDESLL